MLEVPKDRLHLLHITEREVKLNLKKIIAEIDLILRTDEIRIVVTHDHEGGHSVSMTSATYVDTEVHELQRLASRYSLPIIVNRTKE